MVNWLWAGGEKMPEEINFFPPTQIIGFTMYLNCLTFKKNNNNDRSKGLYEMI